MLPVLCIDEGDLDREGTSNRKVCVYDGASMEIIGRTDGKVVKNCLSYRGHIYRAERFKVDSFGYWARLIPI